MDVDECGAHREREARDEALSEGMRAGRLGLASALNPYATGTHDYQQWHIGWHRATAQRVAAQLRERIK
ncbi:MAG: hypothetical protein Q8P46_15630 [Hyphomicrobiales bacterium]|nr:hypothetical protein [Hyphomicrobiales bacterium]